MSYLTDILYATLILSSVVGAVVSTFDGGCTKLNKYLELRVVEYINFLESNEDDDEDVGCDEPEITEKNMCLDIAITEEEIEKQFNTYKTFL